jgi:hypothetical protein
VKGDKRGALTNCQKALDTVADDAQKQRIRAAMIPLQCWWS